MHIISNRFEDAASHHPKWFALYRGKHIVEIWFGSRYWSIGYGDNTHEDV